MTDFSTLTSNFGLVAGAVAAATTALVASAFTVDQNEEALVSRFGRYTGKPRTSGLNFKIPLIDRVDARVSTAIQYIPANLDTKTTDDQFVTLPISIQFSVSDTAKYFYDTNNPNTQIKDIITAEVRKYTSKKDFQELYLDERQEISNAVINSVKSELEDYGITVSRIVIDEPQPDDSTKQAYNDVRASERRKYAAINDAQAEYIKMVKAAEADQKRNELIGEGVKSFRKSIAESYIETRAALIEAGVDDASADAFMVEAMRLDTMRDVGEKGNLVVMALEHAGVDKSVMPQVMAALRVHKTEDQDNNKPATTVAQQPSALDM